MINNLIFRIIKKHGGVITFGIVGDTAPEVIKNEGNLYCKIKGITVIGRNPVEMLLTVLSSDKEKEKK